MALLTATSTVTINPAFLQEIKEVNKELWQLLAELRNRCQRPISPSHCRLLVDRVCELRDQLALHFALEEAYGYFDDPIAAAPRLSHQAEMLRVEHKELYGEFSSLVDHAERMFYDGLLATLALWIGPRFLEFDARLRDHESRENDLIFEAFDDDLGGRG